MHKTVQYDPYTQLVAAPDPEQAEHRYTRLAEHRQAIQALQAAPPALAAGVLALLGYSNFLSNFLLCRPQALPQLLQEPDLRTVGQCRNASELRLCKYQELFKIACRELGEVWDCEQVLRAQSALADAVLARALLLCIPAGEPELCVLALGKLGGAELNFSSDVDLAFVSAAQPDGAAVVAALNHYTRLLNERTEEGFLYRVDLRLRPWGPAGPLLLSVDAVGDYFASGAQAWERLAWMRMRPVTGALAVGMELRERLQPLLYPRSLDVATLQAWVRIKERLSRQRSHPGSWDVKAGEGGIRDLEFFAQLLQFLHGARRPELRATATQTVLSRLPAAGLLSPQEAARARAAYQHLRTIENRLQMVDERQTHHLPDDPPARLRLARSMGIPELSDFESRLQDCRAVARNCFDSVLPLTLDTSLTTGQ